MKPANWDTLSEREQEKVAAEFFRSPRGLFIMGQALAIAEQVLRDKEFPEESNADDMALLGETIFSIGYRLEKHKESLRKKTEELTGSFGGS